MISLALSDLFFNHEAHFSINYQDDGFDAAVKIVATDFIDSYESIIPELQNITSEMLAADFIKRM